MVWASWLAHFSKHLHLLQVTHLHVCHHFLVQTSPLSLRTVQWVFFLLSISRIDATWIKFWGSSRSFPHRCDWRESSLEDSRIFDIISRRTHSNAVDRTKTSGYLLEAQIIVSWKTAFLSKLWWCIIGC